MAGLNMNLKRCTFVAVLALVALSGRMASAVLTGEYLFENSDLLDTSLNNRHGTGAGTVGLPSFGPGLYSGSNVSLRLNSDGTTATQTNAQKVVLPNATNFVTNAPGTTLTAWVQLEGTGGTGNRTILSISNGDVAANAGSGAARATIQINGGTGLFRALGRKDDGGGSSNASAFAPVAGTTYFVAGVFNYAGGYVRLFVDGVQVANSNVAAWTTNSANTANLTSAIGTVSAPSATQEFWPGLIDGARVFNTALTNEQILALYQFPNTVPDPVMPGDTDGDGVVELEDLTPIRQNYLQTVATRALGDLTGDSLVNFADFRQWKTAILSGGGSLTGLDLSFASVPEPTSIGLALAGLCSMFGLRRGRWAGRVAAAATAVLLLGNATAQAAVSVASDPPIPVSPLVATTDPFAAATGGNVGLADVRMIRQTFKNPTTFNVGQIITAFDVTGGTGGFAMSIFEVADVNGSTWANTGPAATPLHSLAFYNNLPGTTQRLGFNLSGADVFELPARFDGTTGYGIEFTTVDQVNNPGQFRHSNTAAADTDFYVDGKYYIQTGASTNGNRDFGLWLSGVDPNIPGPGDVDGLNGVTLDDLNIIAGQFRQSGTRAQGDLTGDGFVDIYDFREWKTNFPGANSGGGGLDEFAALLGVPEPTSALLSMVGLLTGSGIVARRRARLAWTTDKDC
jgi:hypothetical protein